MNGCFGLPEGNSAYYSEQPTDPVSEKEFIFIQLPVLREYLEREMQISSLKSQFDLERAVDDWVFLCFFVGNDFLPHLPSLEIREGALNLLVEIYKECLPSSGGYLTKSGLLISS
jgi:5'-3' exoribonuclease 2